jgi:hypothetical protein
MMSRHELELASVIRAVAQLNTDSIDHDENPLDLFDVRTNGYQFGVWFMGERIFNRDDSEMPETDDGVAEMLLGTAHQVLRQTQRQFERLEPRSAVREKRESCVAMFRRELVGLTTANAMRLCESKGFTMRVMQRDGAPCVGTRDCVLSRVNVSVEHRQLSDRSLDIVTEVNNLG